MVSEVAHTGLWLAHLVRMTAVAARNPDSPPRHRAILFQALERRPITDHHKSCMARTRKKSRNRT